MDWFHFTGITPALGPNVVEICKQACQAAKAKGIKISCDLNYRGKLWTRAQANEAMTELAKYIDVCISNEEDAKDVFGIEAEATDIYGGTINHEGYKSVAKQLADKFGFQKVALDGSGTVDRHILKLPSRGETSSQIFREGRRFYDPGFLFQKI